MVQRNNLVLKKTNREKRNAIRKQKSIASANRPPITNIRRKRKLVEAQNG